MPCILSDESLDTLFRNASREPGWLDRPVGDTLLMAVWELVKLGPVSDGSMPARILFLRSNEAKERLAPTLPPDDRAAMRAAPTTAILASAGAHELALRDGALRGAYLTLAARSLGLDCRPIWDFDAAAVEAAFFPEGTAVAAFLCGLGYGNETRAEPSTPRQGLYEARQIL